MNAQTTRLEIDDSPLAEPDRARILVVETDRRRREWVRAQFEHAGYDVVAAENAREALATWEKGRAGFDLLLVNPETASDAALALWCHLTLYEQGLRVILPLATPEVGTDGSIDPEAAVKLLAQIEEALRFETSRS